MRRKAKREHLKLLAQLRRLHALAFESDLPECNLIDNLSNQIVDFEMAIIGEVNPQTVMDARRSLPTDLWVYAAHHVLSLAEEVTDDEMEEMIMLPHDEVNAMVREIKTGTPKELHHWLLARNLTLV